MAMDNQYFPNTPSLNLTVPLHSIAGFPVDLQVPLCGRHKLAAAAREIFWLQVSGFLDAVHGASGLGSHPAAARLPVVREVRLRRGHEPAGVAPVGRLRSRRLRPAGDLVRGDHLVVVLGPLVVEQALLVGGDVLRAEVALVDLDLRQMDRL